jgi:hypothetical protein
MTTTRKILSRAALGLLLLPLLLQAAASCSGDENAASTAAAGGGGSPPPPPPPPPVAVACDVHATTGMNTFVNRSEAWGLTPQGVVGNRIVSGDLNNDGYPDLIIHAIGTNNREVIGQGPKLIYVLMNEPAEGGGRKFVDKTLESGYATAPDSNAEFRSAQLAVMGDVDNDGDLDVFSGVYTNRDAVKDPPTPADLDRSVLVLNDGAGHFTPAAPSDLQPSLGMPTSGASFVDVDRNGVLDLFLGFFATPTAYSPQQLLLGNKDGTFTDTSQSAGVRSTSTRRAAYGVTTCDLDADGSAELLVSAYARGPNVLYKSDAPLHYVNIGEESGFAFDGNQTYSDNELFKCYCTLHAAEPDCQGVEPPKVQCPMPADKNWYPATDVLPPRLGGNTFSTACSDVTGDGKLDLFNAEIAHWWAGQSSDRSELLINNSDASGVHFSRPGQEATGMTWEHPTVDWNEGGIMAAAADLDNDGREDVLVGASDYPDQYGLFFRQKADGTFEEVGEATGYHHPCVSGLTVADFDRDGDLDLVVGSGTARDCGEIWEKNEVHFYENDASSKGHFLAIKLAGDGVTANRTGIGARVVVDANGVLLTKELGGGYGHMAMQNDTVLFYGLGGCAIVHAVEVTWPDGARTVQRFENVVADRLIEVRQGEAEVVDITPKPAP